MWNKNGLKIKGHVVSINYSRNLYVVILKRRVLKEDANCFRAISGMGSPSKSNINFSYKSLVWCLHWLWHHNNNYITSSSEYCGFEFIRGNGEKRGN